MAIKHIKHLRSLIPEDDLPQLESVVVKQEDSSRKMECNMCSEKFYMGYKEGADEVNIHRVSMVT